MSKYKSLRNFSIPNGKNDDGSQKMRFFVKGEIYEVLDKVASLLGRDTLEPYTEPEKPKRKPKKEKQEKKPDIRLR